jgi:hypothetical protein
MFRTLAIVAVISFAIALLCFAGGTTIAGPEFAKSELWKELAWGEEDFESGGPAVNQFRDLKGFTGVDASAGLEVDVAVGPDFSVEVTGKNPQTVQMEVRDSSLVIRPQGNRSWWRWNSLPRVKISMPTIQSINSSAGADVNATGIQSATLALEASAGAQLQASGACDTLKTEASSGAQIDATSLACKTGNSEVSTGAQTRIYITGLLNVDASTGGIVHAAGNPTRGQISLSTGGTLSP